MNAHSSDIRKLCETCDNLAIVLKRDHDKNDIFLCAYCVGKLEECILCGNPTCCEWSPYTPAQIAAWGYYSPKSIEIQRKKRYALCELCPPDKVVA